MRRAFAPKPSATTPRNDWFKIRGFDAQDIGLFQDGLQLTASYAFATWKFPPWGIERIDILRGPLGGAVRRQQPRRHRQRDQQDAAVPVAEFRRGRPSIPMATVTSRSIWAALWPRHQAPSNELFYRLLGSVKGGDTQTAFTPDNAYFIAPSVTYKPDMDTTFTVLSSASHNDTRLQGFLPYSGTVVNAPFGRIPTGLFASDPASDYFKRTQEMIGYQFEKNLTDSLTFRQNTRYAHDDVQFQTLLGNGYSGPAMLSRFNDFAHDVSNQGNVDSQLEYRFATGLVTHKALLGVDLKYYDISDLQAFSFGTPSLKSVESGLRIRGPDFREPCSRTRPSRKSRSAFMRRTRSSSIV